jgi:hypothetical protein
VSVEQTPREKRAENRRRLEEFLSESDETFYDNIENIKKYSEDAHTVLIERLGFATDRLAQAYYEEARELMPVCYEHEQEQPTCPSCSTVAARNASITLAVSIFDALTVWTEVSDAILGIPENAPLEDTYGTVAAMFNRSDTEAIRAWLVAMHDVSEAISTAQSKYWETCMTFEMKGE